MTTPDARFSRPVFARLRRRCLALSGTTETVSWGHPTFRAGKKTFVAFEIIRGRPSVAFRLPAAEAKKLTRGDQFFATPYGRDAWVSRWLDGEIDWNELEPLVERSYRAVVLSASRSPGGRGPKSPAKS